jgi:hypothetical protein
VFEPPFGLVRLDLFTKYCPSVVNAGRAEFIGENVAIVLNIPSEKAFKFTPNNKSPGSATYEQFTCISDGPTTASMSMLMSTVRAPAPEFKVRKKNKLYSSYRWHKTKLNNWSTTVTDGKVGHGM